MPANFILWTVCSSPAHPGTRTRPPPPASTRSTEPGSAGCSTRRRSATTSASRNAARLFRSTKDVIQIREILQRRGLHLRIATGAWSGFDLAADDPQTKLFVTMLAGLLEFQRHDRGEHEGRRCRRRGRRQDNGQTCRVR
ncbi:recombinase family protein [Streptomyces sp. NBC_01754]|uniref:recombinase family protein n=1 Tax=Streptomyces sp. NBC_01754 TaxID=2975930 RepID=UPI003FA3B040